MDTVAPLNCKSIAVCCANIYTQIDGFVVVAESEIFIDGLDVLFPKPEVRGEIKAQKRFVGGWLGKKTKQYIQKNRVYSPL